MSEYLKPNIARLLLALKGGKPDRVPNFEVLIDNPTLERIVGRTMPHTLSNIPVDDYLDVVYAIGQDAIGLCFYDAPLRYIGKHGEPIPLDFRIRSMRDIERLLPTTHHHLEKTFDLLEIYCNRVMKTDVGVFALTGSFFCSSYDHYIGFEEFMMAVIDNRDMVDQLLEILTSHYETVVRRLVEFPLSFLYIGDDVAYKSGLFIRPQLFRELWVSRMARVMKPAIDKDIPILFHSDGNIMEIIPDLIDMGVNAINPIEPYGMDIRDIRRTYGNRLGLVGNLDVGGSLSTGTTDDVREDARRLIADVGGKGGLILASSHSITKNVVPDNFLAMVDEAHQWRY